MDPVSGVVASKVLVFCISHAKILVELYRTFANAEREMTEVTLQLEGLCIKIEHQLEFMHQVWVGLQESFQVHQIKILSLLETKLQAARDEIAGLTTEPKQGSYVMQLWRNKSLGKRLKYVAWAKSSLQTTMHDLDKWWNEFDMSWYMMARMSSPTLDNLMKNQSIVFADSTISVQSLKSLRIIINKSRLLASQKSSPGLFINGDFPYQQAIPFCSAFLTFDPRINNTLLLETIAQDTYSDYNTAYTDIENIALMLQAIEPVNFGLLRCYGVAKSEGRTPVYQFAFIMPSNFQNPSSLRDLFISQPPYTLNQRLQLARQMSRAVMLVHASSFVHKNIRPETIIVTEEKEDTENKWPFLIGFERFRLAEGKTIRKGDDSWVANLYRHPSRQGKRPDEDYIMQHDIYSLGIILLEIGLWQSLLEWSDNTKSLTPKADLEIDISARSKDPRTGALKTKKVLEGMARGILPQTMGKIYAAVVMSCLTCLDNSENSFGDEDELDDDDGILVGLRYIEKVWTELQKICV